MTEKQMLVNGKSEELVKYSKLKYVAEKFVAKAQELWSYTDTQIRAIYLVSDLAKTGQGVFSIAYSSFQKMFQKRFKKKISLSTVRRFFELMKKLGLISINPAQRKNNQQSANIYIVEQQLEEVVESTKSSDDEQPNEQPSEHPNEHPNEHLNNNVKPNPLTEPSTESLKENVETVVNQYDSHKQEQEVFEVYKDYNKKGINKDLFMRVLEEVQAKPYVKNLVAYLKGALNNVLGHKEVREEIKAMENYSYELQLQKQQEAKSEIQIKFAEWLRE